MAVSGRPPVGAVGGREVVAVGAEGVLLGYIAAARVNLLAAEAQGAVAPPFPGRPCLLEEAPQPGVAESPTRSSPVPRPLLSRGVRGEVPQPPTHWRNRGPRCGGLECGIPVDNVATTTTTLVTSDSLIN